MRRYLAAAYRPGKFTGMEKNGEILLPHSRP